jgi:uncharacterized protein
VVVLRVAEELRLFLPARSRATGRLQVPAPGTASLGHLVESTGVPLPEVGALVRGADRLSPSYRPAGGEVVDVRPVRRPQPLGGPPLLLLDVHLGALARRLRVLGVDTAYRNDADDDELVAQAAREDRLLLTQDRGLLRRRALRRAAYVRGRSPDGQLDDVLDRFRLPLAPFTLCATCGAPLHPVEKAAVAGRLEPGTRRTQEVFHRCSGCGKVYWRGAHAARLEALVHRYAAAGTGDRPADEGR